MRFRFSKTFCVVIVLSVLCVALSACSKVDADYVLVGARDNGFVAAYRGYFAIKGDSVREITEYQCDKMVLGDESEFSGIAFDLMTFDAKADGSDPSTWVYEKNKYIEEDYDVNALIDMLKQMGVSYDGDVYIIITSFDDYTLIEAEGLDGNTVTGSSYGMFRNGARIDMASGIEPQDIRTVYKHK